MSTNRGNFSSRFAVVMALAGSAIGLGNIWRFPYMVGQHGGAAFIIIYILCSIIIALPVFFAESLLGKTTGSDTIGALKKTVKGSPLMAEGGLAVLAAFVIVSFYSVVGGWSFDYFIRSCTGGFQGLQIDQAAQTFKGMVDSIWQPLCCLAVFMAMSGIIVAAGVDKGIGLFSKVMMPILFVMILLIVIRSVSLPGASAGIEYLVKPDFSKIDGRAIADALGQSFFSLSLGVGCVLTYSSYMRNEENIFYSGIWTAVFDTIFALLAGFAIMPAVFASGLEAAAGPSLVYETLPVIFSQMGPVVPFLFFLAILIAALTSSISMMEVCVAWLVDQKHIKRGSATIIICCLAFLLGCACAIFPKVFNTCDFMTSNVFMMIGSFVFVIVVAWKIPKIDVRTQFTNYGTSKAAKAVFPVIWFSIKWLCPIAIVAIAITNLL